jgi:hypothetical protein
MVDNIEYLKTQIGNPEGAESKQNITIKKMVA